MGNGRRGYRIQEYVKRKNFVYELSLLTYFTSLGTILAKYDPNLEGYYFRRVVLNGFHGHYDTHRNNGMLCGAVSYFGNIYIIEFYPRYNIIKWRIASTNDVGNGRHGQGGFGITQQMWDEHQSQRSDDQSSGPVPPGFIQNEMISRLVEHIIHISSNFERPDITLFYNNFRWMKRSKIKSIPVSNLNRDTKNSITFFIVALAIIDPTTQWKKYNKSMEYGDTEPVTGTTIALIGQPSMGFGHTFLKYTTTIEYWTSNWEIDEGNISYGCWARMVFLHLQSMTEEYDKKVMALCHQKHQ